jgi:hypothetical protein
MGLSFLTPLLLAGAALIAVPIVLHLIMRREPKHLIFPALRFIQKREEANRRRLRLRHLLLLLMRCAAIVLLAAAIARPSLKSAGFVGDREAPVAAAFVFDTSVRMDYQHQNKSRLQVAQDLALWLLPQLPADSDIAVLDSSVLATAFAVDPVAARQRVERLATVAAPQPWLELVESALQLVNDSTKERKEVYLFTDLARASWPAEARDQFKARVEQFPDVAVYVIDVGVADPRNFALGDVKLSHQTIAKNSPLEISTELARTGPGEERAVGIYVFDSDGRPQKRGEQSFGWLDGQSLRAGFELSGLGLGTHQGMLKIIGDDALSADNVRYFTVEVRPAWKVLIVAPRSAVTLFLHEALAPEENRQKRDARFDVTMIALDKLADEPLEDYAAVCLLDPTPLAPSVWNKLREYVAYGGGLAVWLGRSVGEVDEFNSDAALEVLPGKVVRQARASDELYLAPPDLEHPTLRGFRSKGSQIPWSSFPVVKYWQLDELKDGVNVIIPYTNRRPALVEHAIGRGRVLTMTTPVSQTANDRDAWNTLATGFQPWPFFVLMQEMGAYLVGSADEQFNYAAGDTVVMQLPDQQRSLVFTLRTPQDLQIPQTVDQQHGTLTVSSTSAPGNYQLQAGGSEGGVRRGFSANVPLAITRLDRIKAEDLDGLFGPKRYRLARNQDEILRDVSIGRVGVELYPLLVVLVALILGLEHVLANRFYRRNTSVAMEPVKPASLESLSTTASNAEQPNGISANGSTADGMQTNGAPVSPQRPPSPPESKQPARVG